jgi:hypothetical protein
LRDFLARRQECKVTGSQTSLRAAKSPTLGQDDKWMMVIERVLRVESSRVSLRPGPSGFVSASSAGTFFPSSFSFFCFQKSERRITNYCHICNAELNPDGVFELQCRNGKKMMTVARAFGLLSFGGAQSPPASVSEAQTRPPSLWRVTLTCARNELMEDC